MTEMLGNGRSRAAGRPRKRHAASKRHTIQVDFDDYLYALDKERAQGFERARADGFQPPLQCLHSAGTTVS
jgi:hypothetical protein